MYNFYPKTHFADYICDRINNSNPVVKYAESRDVKKRVGVIKNYI
jgi:hypothetical protein